MQAVQLLNQQNAVPNKNLSFDVSTEKENSTSSFKSFLENVSKRDDNANDVSKNDKVPLKKENVSKDTSVKDKESQNGVCASFVEDAKDASCDSVSIDESVLFGQLVEVVSTESVAVGSEMEDVTSSVRVYDVADVETVIVSPMSDARVAIAYGEGLSQDLEDVVLPAFSEEMVETGIVDPSNGEPAEKVAELFADPLMTSEVQEVASETVQQGVAFDEDSKSVAKLNKEKNADRDVGLSKKSASDVQQSSVITVIDQRGVASKAADSSSEASLVADSVKKTGSTLDISFNLNQTALVDAANQNILSTSDQAAGADGSVFQRMLSNQLMTQAPEFVKAGSIILKDSDTGTINLNLKPEALGNVKITLQVTDKGIEGQITVASKEAFEAFKQNMDSLKQSFEQNGFDSTKLNLSFANNSGSDFGGEQHRSSEEFFGNKTFSNFAEGGDKPLPAVANAYGGGDYHVDVVA